MFKGAAKARFLESRPHSPLVRNESFPGHWNFIRLLIERQFITYLDYLMTLQLLKKTYSECQAVFILHILLAAKNGHLCVSLGDEAITPPIHLVWQSENGESLSEDETKSFLRLLIEGKNQLPPELYSVVEQRNRSEFLETPLIKYKNFFYLQRYWTYETLFLHYLSRLSESPPHIQPDLSLIDKGLAQMTQECLLPEQAAAIKNGCLYSFSIITGGPGTGKTFTAGQLIKIFWLGLSTQQKINFEIALAAPTGKAAANLQHSLSQSLNNLPDFPTILATTLHSLLGIKSSIFIHEQTPLLSADLILVDESSMVDLQLMTLLFKSIKKGARLILLGDPHQLPSIEAGNVFGDLLNMTKAIPKISLNQCLRSELKSLIHFAQCIKEGNSNSAIHILSHQNETAIKLNPLPTTYSERQQLFQQLSLDFPLPSYADDEADCLNIFKGIRILSPFKEGMYGFKSVNLAIWERVSQIRSTPKGWIAIPIMITVNDYKRDLFNGETGVLMRKIPLKSFCKDEYALFPSRNHGEPPRKIPFVMLPKFELAYCLSVHKSQGSEFNHVILLIPPGSEKFGRSVLYTGVTRARQSIEVFCSELTLAKTIQEQSSRHSGIMQ